MVPVLIRDGGCAMLAPAGFLGSIDPERLRIFRAVILKAGEIVGLGPYQLAQHQEIDPRQFARQLDGEGHISLTRLGTVEEERGSLEFLRWFFLLGCEAFGLPREVKRAEPIKMVLAERRDARDAEEEKARIA